MLTMVMFTTTMLTTTMSTATMFTTTIFIQRESRRPLGVQILRGMENQHIQQGDITIHVFTYQQWKCVFVKRTWTIASTRLLRRWKTGSIRCCLRLMMKRGRSALRGAHCTFAFVDTWKCLLAYFWCSEIERSRSKTICDLVLAAEESWRINAIYEAANHGFWLAKLVSRWGNYITRAASKSL